MNLYANNASDTLNGAITNVATSITLNDASEFQAIGAGEQYYLTITDGTNIEIVLATALSTNTFTVTRGQQGTSGTAFADGSLVEQRITKGDLDNFVQMQETGAIDFSGASEFKIPTDTSPTVNADGEMALDTNVTDWSHSIPKIYGGEELAIVTMPVAELTSPVDGANLSYNATNDEMELVTLQPVANGGTGVAALPLMLANISTTQTISTATFTKMQFDNETLDPEGDYDNTTNYRFTPSQPGTYYVGASMVYQTAADQMVMIVGVYKNGSPVSYNAAGASGTGQNGILIGSNIAMNGTTDYVEIYAYQASGSNKDLNSNSNLSISWVGP